MIDYHISRVMDNGLCPSMEVNGSYLGVSFFIHFSLILRRVIIFSRFGSIVVVRVVMVHGFVCVAVFGIDILSVFGTIVFMFFGRDWGLKGGWGVGCFKRDWASCCYPWLY